MDNENLSAQFSQEGKISAKLQADIFLSASPIITDYLKGDTGETGNGIQSVELDSVNGKKKTYRITFTDGGSTTFVVSDGADGSGLQFNWDGPSLGVKKDGDESYVYTYLKGEKGDTGAQGETGAPGRNGRNGVDGKDGKDGINGADGRDGAIQYAAGTGISISNDTISCLIPDLSETVATKQDKLVSGSNIKTINNQSILGSGNITIESESGVSNYEELSHLPKINNVELKGNKSLSDLGINIPTVPTNVSSFTNDAGYITSSYHDSTKVDVEEGMGLSSNDFKDYYKELIENWDNLNIDGFDTRISNCEDVIPSSASSNNKLVDANTLATELSAKQNTIDSSHKLDYSLISNTPTIPTVPTNISSFNNDAGYLTTHQDISGKEDISNKVASLSSSSTDTQYPSAKCVYDLIGDVESILYTLNSGGGAE